MAGRGAKPATLNVDRVSALAVVETKEIKSKVWGQVNQLALQSLLEQPGLGQEGCMQRQRQPL
jgi:hypothetical protein